MFLDRSEFPLVFVRSGETMNDNVEDQLRHLLERKEEFVLITDHSEDDHDNENHEDKKKRNLFIKSIKGDLRKYCMAMIFINRRTITALERMAAATAAKAFGFSIAIISDEESARQAAKGHLAKAIA